MHARFCLCSPSLESLFPQACGGPVINPTGLQDQIPWGFPVPLLGLQAGKPDVGFQNFITVGELP